ncbi:MAG: tetratricopeptide repeat protein [Leptonema sp. (in: Bacteria)]|nr:tetratricopeptide repeat protein [Leptonema sp. (in: bacteria)]
MRSFLTFIIVLLSVVSACTTFETKSSDAKHTEYQGDPTKVAKVRSLLEQGNLALVKHDSKTAKSKAESANAIFETFDGYYLLGMAQRDLQNPDDALQALLHAEQIQPENEQLLLTLGLLYGSQDELDTSLKYFDRLLKLKPEDPVYNYRAGVISKEQKNYDRALAYLQKADVDSFENRDQALLQLGDVCLELRRFDEADTYFQRARAANPKMKDALQGSDDSQTARYLDQGNEFFKKKDYVKAEAAYREAAQLSPKSSAPLVQLALVYLARGDLAHGRSNLEQALKLSSNNNEARILLASTARRQADYDRSKQLIDEGLKQNPNDPELLNQLGLHYAAQQEREKSAITFERLLSKNEKYTPARKNLLVQYIEMGRFGDARHHLSILKKQEPSSAQEWKEAETRISIHELLERGHSLFQKGQYRKAEVDYNRALNLKKDYIPTLIALGKVRSLNSNYRGSEIAYKAVLNIEPENPQALEGLLSLYQKTKNVKAKLALENEIRAMSAKNPEVMLSFARLKEEDGRSNEAFNDYQELLKKMPDNGYIKRRMASIRISQAVEQNSKNRFDEAISLLNQAQKIDATHPALESNRQIIEENKKYSHLIPELEKAEKAFQRRDFKTAESAFNQLYKKWPRSSFLVRLAEIRFETGRDADGQAMLAEALKKDPADIKYREALYSRLLDRRQLSEAEDGFKKILSEDESAYFSSYKLGIIQMLNKRYDSALELFQQSLLYRPEFLPARIARGVVFYDKDKEAEARREFEEARKIENHGKEIALLNLTMMDWNNGSLRTEQELIKLNKEFPDFADPWYHLAYLSYDKHNYKTALTQIDQALKLNRSADFLYARIEILEKLKSSREIDITSRQFLKEYPGDERTKKVRQLLAKLGNQKDYIEPTMKYPVGQDSVYGFESSFLIVRPEMVLGVERGSDRLIFQKQLQVKSHFVNGFLYVLTDDHKLLTIDPETGEQIQSEDVAENSCSVFDANTSRVIVQFDCKSNQPVQYMVIDSITDLKTAVTRPPASQLHLLNDNLYASLEPRLIQIAANPNFTDSKKFQIKETDQPILAISTLISENEPIIVAQTDSELIFLDSDASVVRKVKLEGRKSKLSPQPILVNGRKVTVLSTTGKTVQDFALPTEPLNLASISSISEDRLSYVDKNKNMILVDPVGKILLEEDLKKVGASVYRLYSVADTK